MKIAIFGTRGIPARYGGFETFAEQLSTRLVERGHEVVVYCRSNNVTTRSRVYKGVKLVVLPTIRHKYLDTVVHSFLSALHLSFQKCDVVLMCNSVNSAFCPILRLMGKKVAINVDGLDWKRKKWNKLGQWVYKASEYLATVLPNEVVTDSTNIQQYYLSKFGKRSTFIPYGAPTTKVLTRGALDRFGLERRKYVLYVSRLEPEGNAHLVVKAFEKVRTDLNLVVVGDAPYGFKYIRRLRNTVDSRIIFTGYVFGQGYRELQSNAYFYVQATEAGGTHPALLEAMGHGNCVLANDVPEHREVIEDSGIFFATGKDGDLENKMQYLLDTPSVVEAYRRKAVERIKENYVWEKVTDDYYRLFLRMQRSKA